MSYLILIYISSNHSIFQKDTTLKIEKCIKRKFNLYKFKRLHEMKNHYYSEAQFWILHKTLDWLLNFNIFIFCVCYNLESYRY